MMRISRRFGALLLCVPLVTPAALGAQNNGLPKLIPPSPGTYRPLLFSQLSAFVYSRAEPQSPDPKPVENGIPFQVQVLDGQRIEMAGIMMPTSMEAKGTVSEFILATNSDACAFGMPLLINEWAVVRMAPGKTTAAQLGKSVTVRGVLRVREEVEQGRVVGLFRIAADDVR
jgi:hypothetical protein